MVPCSVPTSIALSQVTLGIQGLSWDYLSSPQHLCGRVSWSNTGIPGIIPGLPSPLAPLWQSIPVHRSNTGSPGITLGVPSPPAPLWQSIPVRRSNTGSPGIIPGLPSIPAPLWQSIPVWTLAVPGVSRDYLGEFTSTTSQTILVMSNHTSIFSTALLCDHHTCHPHSQILFFPCSRSSPIFFRRMVGLLSGTYVHLQHLLIQQIVHQYITKGLNTKGLTIKMAVHMQYKQKNL